MRSVKGFTLIELMVTIVVAAIIASIALPAFQNLIISNRLNTTATEMVDAISFSRSESIKLNRPITFCRASSAAANTCAAGTGWEHWIVVDGNRVLRRGLLNTFDGTLGVTSDLTEHRATFGGDGLARTGANVVNEALISICAESGPTQGIRNVTFGAAGRISSTSATGSCS